MKNSLKSGLLGVVGYVITSCVPSTNVDYVLKQTNLIEGDTTTFVKQYAVTGDLPFRPCDELTVRIHYAGKQPFAIDSAFITYAPTLQEHTKSYMLNGDESTLIRETRIADNGKQIIRNEQRLPGENWKKVE